MGNSILRDSHVRTLALTGIYLLACGVFTYVYWVDKVTDYSFGYEYGNVAASVATGNGFADVFGDGAGPTSWCPPAYVLIHASMYVVFGVKTPAAMWALLFLRVLVLTGTLYLLLRIDYSPPLNKYRFLIMPVFALLSGVILIKDFDDKALNVFLSVVTVYLVAQIAEKGFEKYKTPAYVLAIVLPLSNVFLLGGSLLLVLANSFFLINKREAPVPGRHCIALILLAVAATLTWGIRNKAVLGQFVPFKSNLWFEVYMSNVADADGVMQRSNWIAHHPIANPDVAQSYVVQGELQFMERYKRETIDYLKTNSGDFVRKVLRRSAHAFIFLISSDDLITADTINIPAGDLDKLRAQGALIWDYWVNLDIAEQDFRSTVNKINLSRPSLVIKDWQEKKDLLASRKFRSLGQTAAGFLYALVPTVAILICLCFKSIRNLTIFRLTLYFLFLSWTPYIVLSHYARYQMFQVGMFTVLIFLCLAGMLEATHALRHSLSRYKGSRLPHPSHPDNFPGS